MMTSKETLAHFPERTWTAIFAGVIHRTDMMVSAYRPVYERALNSRILWRRS